MRELNDIISASIEATRPLLREAYESGRAVGRAEASGVLKEKINNLLSADIGKPDDPPEPVAIAPHSGKRAAQGSVKPKIVRILEDSGAGLETDEICQITGCKPNSVRGTLWALSKEGVAVKRDGRWFHVAKANDGTSSQLPRKEELSPGSGLSSVSSLNKQMEAVNPARKVGGT